MIRVYTTAHNDTVISSETVFEKLLTPSKNVLTIHYHTLVFSSKSTFKITHQTDEIRLHTPILQST